MSDESNPFKGWHVRKEIHAGHIVTTVMMIVAATLAWSRLESLSADHERRLSVIERRAELDETPQRLARIEALLEILVRRYQENDQ